MESYTLVDLRVPYPSKCWEFSGVIFFFTTADRKDWPCAVNWPILRPRIRINLSIRISGFMRWSFKLFYKRDRKSTRLNSSHVKISYAVFCLKKKKKKNKQIY